MTSTQIAPSTTSNVEIVVLAVYLLGGADGPVNTEDVAIKANKLAPGRFTWHRYKNQVSIEHIRVYLSDAKKQKNGRLLSGDGTKGWQLTSAGLRFTLSVKDRVKGVTLARPRLNRIEERRRKAELARLSQLPAWDKFRRSDAVSRREAEAVFRLTDYVRGARRETLIDRVRILFVHQPEFEAFVNEMARIVAAPTTDPTGDR